MLLEWSPICEFKNIQIDENDTITDFINSCALNSYRRVKFSMTTDSNHTDTKLYALTISGIPIDSAE